MLSKNVRTLKTEQTYQGKIEKNEEKKKRKKIDYMDLPSVYIGLTNFIILLYESIPTITIFFGASNK